MLLDVLLRVAHGLDSFRLFVRDFHPELFLKTHDELDKVERVSVEIVHERGLRLYVNLVDAELLDDDLLEAIVGVSLRQQIPPPGQVRPLPRPPAAAGRRKCPGTHLACQSGSAKERALGRPLYGESR